MRFVPYAFPQFLSKHSHYIPPCHFLSGSNVALRWKAKGRQIPKLGPEEEGDWQGPFFFVLGADTQLGLIDQMNNVTVNPSQ